MQVPLSQVSVCVQALPSSHDVSFGFDGLEHPVAGSQVPASWHWSRGVQMTAFDPMHVPF